MKVKTFDSEDPKQNHFTFFTIFTIFLNQADEISKMVNFKPYSEELKIFVFRGRYLYPRNA